MISARGHSITRRVGRRRGVAALALGASGLFAVAATSLAALNPTLVSSASDGTPANANSGTPTGAALSGNGRLVAFQSAAANLPGGNGTTAQAYAKNLATGKVRLASRAANGDPSGSGVQVQGISANGRYVTFISTGTGLPGANGQNQAWVRDLKRGKTRIASRANDGSPGDAPSGDPSLSANGRRVVFSSQATNLPGGDAPGPQVYIRDLAAKKTILASRDTGGDPATGNLYGQTISSNGRQVAFSSNDEDLPRGDGAIDHTYVRDLSAKRTLIADLNRKGKKSDASSNNASISGDGRSVIFESEGTNMPGQTGHQVYVRDLARKRTIVAGRNSQSEPQDGYAEFAHLSGNGRVAQFNADGDNLPGGNASDDTFTYVRDLKTGKTKLVSRAANGDVPEAEAQSGSISLDGRWVAFESSADNLGGNSAYTNVFRVGPLG